MSKIIEQYTGKTITKRELIDLLLSLDAPDDMPVLIGYEGTVAPVEPEYISKAVLYGEYEVLLLDTLG